MYATTSASLSDHAVRSASPRPLRSRCSTRTLSSDSASSRATRRVPSVLALSATVTEHRNGKSARCRSRTSRHPGSERSSLYTGMIRSTVAVRCVAAARSGARSGSSVGHAALIRPLTSFGARWAQGLTASFDEAG